MFKIEFVRLDMFHVEQQNSLFFKFQLVTVMISVLFPIKRIKQRNRGRESTLSFLLL